MTAQRELASLTRPPAMPSERATRVDDILFDNVPSFDHLAKKKHAEALAASCRACWRAARGCYLPMYTRAVGIHASDVALNAVLVDHLV